MAKPTYTKSVLAAKAVQAKIAITASARNVEAQLQKANTAQGQIFTAMSKPKAVFARATVNKFLAALKQIHASLRSMESTTHKSMRTALAHNLPTTRLIAHKNSLALVSARVASMALVAKASLGAEQDGDEEVLFDDQGQLIDADQTDPLVDPSASFDPDDTSALQVVDDPDTTTSADDQDVDPDSLIESLDLPDTNFDDAVNTDILTDPDGTTSSDDPDADPDFDADLDPDLDPDLDVDPGTTARQAKASLNNRRRAASARAPGGTSKQLDVLSSIAAELVLS